MKAIKNAINHKPVIKIAWTNVCVRAMVRQKRILYFGGCAVDYDESTESTEIMWEDMLGK
jgi:hypothetical protein